MDISFLNNFKKNFEKNTYFLYNYIGLIYCLVGDWMICKKCGKKNDRIQIFCSNCGSKIKKKNNYNRLLIIVFILIGVGFAGQRLQENIKEYVDTKILSVSKEIMKDSDEKISKLNVKEENLNYTQNNSLENYEVQKNDIKQQDSMEYINDDVLTSNVDIEESWDEINTKVIDAIERLQENYDSAINTGNVNLVYPYITTTGNLYDSYSKYIPIWHEEGMKTFVEEAEYTDIKLDAEDTYRVGRYSICRVDRNGLVVYEKEYIDFIVKKEKGDFLVDSCKNYRMIDNNYNY